LKGAEKLTDWERPRLNQLLYLYPESNKAWLFKESFRTGYDETDRNRAEEMLELLKEQIAIGHI